MEYLVILILIIVVVVLLVRQSGSTPAPNPSGINPMNHLISEIFELKKQVKELKAEINDNTREIKNSAQEIKGQIVRLQQTQPGRSEGDVPVVKPEEKEVNPAFSSIFIIPEPQSEPIQEEQAAGISSVTEAPAEEIKEEKHEEPATEMPVEEQTTERVEAPPVAGYYTWQESKEHIAEQERHHEPDESRIDKWMRNNPDLEKFIGENLVNKIGIAVLVLGIAFFVKYAIDQNWINEIGRVSIGMGCGALLVGLAHYLRKGYRSFSSVLAGGGIAVFYFTIAFGFHQYHLMSQTAAFVIMVVITAFSIALSVLYDRLELAIIATIGGFLAPFLVSTGDGNYVVLFTYLIILNIGVLTLSYFKRWTPLNIIALFFTELIYGGWLASVINDPSKHISYSTALIFASSFYAIFIGMNMVNQVRNNSKFKPFDFIILLLISSSYFAAGILLLHAWNGGAYQGIFTLVLGLVNLALAYYVYINGKADRNLLFLLIGITLTFITLTIPIQLHGHAITMFWSAEFVLLYWLSEYSGIRIFRYSSLIICLLTLISLGMDWAKASQVFPAGLLLIYTNVQGLVTNLVAIAAFTVWHFLLRKNKEENIGQIPIVSIARMSVFIAVALQYLTCIFGVNLAYRQYTSYAIPNIDYRFITLVFSLALMFIIKKRRINISPWLPFILLVINVLVLFFSTGYVIEVRDEILNGKAAWVHFFVHWADTVLLGILFYKAISEIRKEQGDFVGYMKLISVIITAMILAFLSLEILHVYVFACFRSNNIYSLTEQYCKAGLTALWGICSFILMWVGMKQGNKILRIISLVLFSIVLLKLFIIDISGISEGGKILAFILLGVLLLTVSFMYQKLKKIIIDDKKE